MIPIEHPISNTIVSPNNAFLILCTQPSWLAKALLSFNPTPQTMPQVRQHRTSNSGKMVLHQKCGRTKATCPFYQNRNCVPIAPLVLRGPLIWIDICVPVSCLFQISVLNSRLSYVQQIRTRDSIDVTWVSLRLIGVLLCDVSSEDLRCVVHSKWSAY